MIATDTSSESSLPKFLAARARQASDARLALDVAGGFVAAIVAIIWRGPGWQIVTSGAVCFLAYGAWGIADRELTERAITTRTGLRPLAVGRAAATAIGAAAAVLFVFGLLFKLLGTIKS